MTLFGRLDVAAQAVHERVFGEAFTHRPMHRGPDVNAPWRADPEREICKLVGIYTERDLPPEMGDQIDQRLDRKPGVSAHVHMIEIDARRITANINVADHLVRLADGAVWRVVSIDPDTDGRLFCNVTRVA